MKNEKLVSSLVAIAITSVLAFVFAQLSVDVFETYGWGVFVAAPIICGIVAVWIFNRRGRKRCGESIKVSILAGCISLLGFLVVGFEGLICLVMAIPVVLPSFLVGGLIGFYISRAIGRRIFADIISVLLVLLLPFFIGAESLNTSAPAIRTSITSVIIDAPVESVWKEVIEFSEIPEPEEFLFRVGIAYPINARIEGDGVGAVRYCNFSTGSFVEPITHWEENRKLAFDVMEQPHPMKELSLHDHLHPPHLDWAIRSLKGQFILTELADGRIELEGTTWFFTKMSPEPYWSWISGEMIHMIHLRVLEHIKVSAEGANKT